MTSGYDYESEYHIDPHLPELFSTHLVDEGDDPMFEYYMDMSAPAYGDEQPPIRTRAADTGLPRLNLLGIVQGIGLLVAGLTEAVVEVGAWVWAIPRIVLKGSGKFFNWWVGY